MLEVYSQTRSSLAEAAVVVVAAAAVVSYLEFVMLVVLDPEEDLVKVGDFSVLILRNDKSYCRQSMN